MARIPDAVQELLDGFSEKLFTVSVWQRFASLLTAAVMVRGRRPIWRLILGPFQFLSSCVFPSTLVEFCVGKMAGCRGGKSFGIQAFWSWSAMTQ